MGRPIVTVCSRPGCPELRPCPTEGHEPVPWESSTRRRRLPSDWNRRRKRILRRDPICQGCKAAPSQQVDHVDGTDNHDDSNLQGLCIDCHATKTKAEAAAGRRRHVR